MFSKALNGQLPIDTSDEDCEEDEDDDEDKEDPSDEDKHWSDQ